MHALAQVANGVAAHGHALDETENSASVLHRDALLRLEELLKQGTGNLVAKFRIARECDEQAASQVLDHASDLVREPRHIVLADVRHQDIRQEVAGRHRSAAVGSGQGCSGNVLVQIRDLHKLVLHMGGLGGAVVVADRGRSTEHHVAQTGLADVGASVVGGEALHKACCKLDLAIHEDVLGRYHNVLEAHHCLLRTKVRVAPVDGVVLLHGTEIATLPAVDVREPRRVGGDGAGDGIVLLGLIEPAPWHDEHEVRVQRPGLVHLRAAQRHAAVGPPLAHVNEEVRILLLARVKVAIALRVRHGTADHAVHGLGRRHELLEAIVVGGTVLLVDVISCSPHRVQGVHTDATLEATAGAPAKLALHLRLLHEVFGRLADVKEAAHAHAAEADRGAQLRIVCRQAVSLRQGVHCGPHDRMVHEVCHPLSPENDLDVPVAQGLDVVLSRHDAWGAGGLVPWPGHEGGQGCGRPIGRRLCSRCHRRRYQLRCCWSLLAAAATAAAAAAAVPATSDGCTGLGPGIWPSPLRQVLDVDLPRRGFHLPGQRLDASSLAHHRRCNGIEA
mmetsp:Transcript_15520/g.32802  ORF Transcript_15520/g.32802 Transcript_15520/m.32802 type:complete len:560 (+) Transcript_15520:206-1885(+)